MHLLDLYGWQRFCQANASLGRSGSLPSGLEPARVIRQERDLYRVVTASGERAATLAGRLRHSTWRREDLPVPGDWVAVRSPEGAHALVHGTLPRTSLLLRRSSGGKGPQPLAANVDVTLIVTAADRDLNLRRLERYLTLVRGSGSEAHVVLNKVDLHPDLGALERELEPACAGATFHRVSATAGLGLDSLREDVLGPGRTIAVLGSSGVGKSTLCNALLGAELQDTGAERESDGRGRHTTTRRDLLLAPEARGIIVDTPGLREVGLWESDELEGTFPELAALAEACRYRDCQHQGEPECAVEDAIERGELDLERVLNYEKLLRELARNAPGKRKSTQDRARGKRNPKAKRKPRSARRSDW